MFDGFLDILGPFGMLLIILSPVWLIIGGKLLFRYIFKKLDAAILDKVMPDAFCMVDCETTGLKVSDSQIIEIAAIKVRKGMPDEHFRRFIAYEGKLPRKIVKLTGIKDKMLVGADSEADVMQEFTEFVGDDLIVAYNASFDMKFIKSACRRAKLPFKNESDCALALARRAWPKEKGFKLSEVAARRKIKVAGAHRALSDCQMALQVYKAALIEAG